MSLGSERSLFDIIGTLEWLVTHLFYPQGSFLSAVFIDVAGRREGWAGNVSNGPQVSTSVGSVIEVGAIPAETVTFSIGEGPILKEEVAVTGQPKGSIWIEKISHQGSVHVLKTSISRG